MLALLLATPAQKEEVHEVDDINIVSMNQKKVKVQMEEELDVVDEEPQWTTRGDLLDFAKQTKKLFDDEDHILRDAAMNESSEDFLRQAKELEEQARRTAEEVRKVVDNEVSLAQKAVTFKKLNAELRSEFREALEELGPPKSQKKKPKPRIRVPRGKKGQ